MTRGVGGRGPANIMHHIKGIKFPATKQDLITCAQRHAGEMGYPDTEQVIVVFQSLDQDEFNTVAEVMKSAKRVM